MYFITGGTLKYAWQSERRALARSQIPSNCEATISVLRRFGISAVLLAGLVAAAGAQTNDSATYYLKRGVERYKARDFDAAIDDYSQAIEINSGFVKGSSKKLSGSNFKSNQNAGIADDDRVVVANSFNAVAYYNRGMAWLAAGNADRAIDDFSKAISIDPRYTDAYVTRGRAWHSKGHLARALEDYNKAVALDPRSSFAYNNRGIARKEMQDLTGAIGDFDKAIMLNPHLVPA